MKKQKKQKKQKKREKQKKVNSEALFRAFLKMVIGVCVTYFITILLKQFWAQSPSLDTSESEIHAPFTYCVTVPGDTSMDHYLAFEADQTGWLSFKLTNNDESTLVVDDIYLDLYDYQPISDIKIPSEVEWSGNYSTPVYYGVHLDNLCKEYKCTLLDEKSARTFSAQCELLTETNYYSMSEQIEYNKTDEIRILFSTLYPGIYRFKIVIDYSIRSFNGRVESGEFVFISLDPSSIS